MAQQRTRRTGISKKQIIEALEAAGGFVTEAARKLGVTHQAVSYHIKNNPKVAEAYENIIERRLDLAESKLVKAVNNGEAWAICFFLKCQGKKRGYVERLEQTGADGSPLHSDTKIEVVFVKPGEAA